MNKRKAIPWAVALSLCVVSGAYAGTYSGGTGVETDPYLLSDPADLVELSLAHGAAPADLSAWFRVTQDIDMSAVEDLTPIAPDEGEVLPFNGQIDGDGHTIAGLHLYVVEDPGRPMAWICETGTDALITALHFTGVDIGGLGIIATVAVRNRGTIEDCTVAGVLESRGQAEGLYEGEKGLGSASIGGVCWTNYGLVQRCTSSVEIGSCREAGGVVNANYIGGQILDCVFNGSIGGDPDYAAGIAEVNGGLISRCIYSGTFLRGLETAGIVTRNNGAVTQCCSYPGGRYALCWTNNGAISQSYAACPYGPEVSSVQWLIGWNYPEGILSQCYMSIRNGKKHRQLGFLGGVSEVQVADCFWDMNATGVPCSALGGQGRTTVEMMRKATFTTELAALGETPWDFENVWDIREGQTYPWLRALGEIAVVPYEVSDLPVAEWPHDADLDGDLDIELSDLLRVIQFYNAGGYHCAEAGAETEDGFVAGPSVYLHNCRRHDSDYLGGEFSISLDELLRLIQFYNSDSYHYCPCDGTEDGFAPGPPPE